MIQQLLWFTKRTVDDIQVYTMIDINNTVTRLTMIDINNTHILDN